jgi:hypothetical protein
MAVVPTMGSIGMLWYLGPDVDTMIWEFLRAWEGGDADRVASYFTEDGVSGCRPPGPES